MEWSVHIYSAGSPDCTDIKGDIKLSRFSECHECQHDIPEADCYICTEQGRGEANYCNKTP